MIGRRCLAPARHEPRRQACSRVFTQGALRFVGHAGVNRVRFEGRISSAKSLKPGGYAVALTATNSAGTSRPQSLSFTIVR